MKKIIFLMLLILNSFSFAIDDIVDKDNMHNLIEGVTSTRFGSDRVSTIYDFAPLMNHNTPLKLGVSILDLSHIVDNKTNAAGERKLAFLPKGFVGLSYGIFGFGYQFNLYNDLSEKNMPVAHSHSFSFGLAMEKYRFTLPFSFSIADQKHYGGKLSLSTTPKFSFMFRGGLLDEFTMSLHYGIQLSSVTNNVSGTQIAPMVIGGSLYGSIMLTRFDNYPVQISLPVKLAFYYGIGARWATIDAGYAEDALLNYLYDDEGGRSTDSMYFYVLLPAKFEAKLGAIYTYVMPRLMFEGKIYKVDGEYNLHYGIEGEARITLVENFTFGFTGYAEGQGIMKKSADFNIYNAFGGGIDIWGIWRY
ncbi:cell surface protein [Brachyspira intermedia]|uniref:cell surface protein n=1 Tax=Brachyspira intermedia TaxID=84377 RepID=UPI00300435DC